ncbi:MAG: hypothetical protein HQ463_02550 [Bacteroidetes bacterium]|nr:hypothetical protein [Bacteroidota bacterium]
MSPNGIGNNYTETQPCDLKTLLQAGLSCGTTVLLKNGTYFIGDININLNSNCTENTPITIISALGEKAILDGGLHQNYTWSKFIDDTLVYYTTLPPSADFTSLCILDTAGLYPYATHNSSTLGGYTNLQSLIYNLSGFYRKNESALKIIIE